MDKWMKPAKGIINSKSKFHSNSIIKKGLVSSWFKDSDRDGVPNIFDCQPHNPRKQGWSQSGHTFSRERSTHIRMMTPDKFLRTTYRESANRGKVVLSKEGDRAIPHQVTERSLSSYKEYSSPKGTWHDPENVERVKKVIRSRQGKMEIPYLEYDEQGRPTGHEGRHRATAAKQLGVKLIPVTIARKLKHARDWEHTREVYGTKTKKKDDWKYDLENVEQATSSKSADIPIKQQREYGKEKPEALQSLDEDKSAQELIDED
jgi:hypothetical protein